MKTLKITLLLTLFVVTSSQTYKMPSEKEITTKDTNTQKTKKTEFDLLAHIVRGVRVPTQG